MKSLKTDALKIDEATVARYREREFPITRRVIHLNHASLAPTSNRAAEAVAGWVRSLAEEPEDEAAWEASADRCRERLASLLGCTSDEVAFVRNTSHGLSLIAEGIAWETGDRIAVASEIEYPSNVHPWRRKARELGHELIEIPHCGGVLDLDALATVLRQRPRLLALSSAQFASGVNTDLPTVGRLCRQWGVLFCVDGIQTVGVLPIDVHQAHIDFLTADSHKWMLGMPGAGVLYVDSQHIGDLRPALIGWKSVVDAWQFDSRLDTLLPNAGRLEEGSPSYAVIEGLSAAVELLQEVSVEAIAGRVGYLVDRLAEGLLALGCSIGPDPDSRHHILTFTHPKQTLEVLVEELWKRKILLSQRGVGVRVAPHFYNTEAEIDFLIETVREILNDDG